jgi:hypothetical protein
MKIDEVYNNETPKTFKKFLNKLIRNDPINNVFLLSQHLQKLHEKFEKIENAYDDDEDVSGQKNLVNEVLLVESYWNYMQSLSYKRIGEVDKTLKTEPEVYIQTVTTFGYQIEGFAQAYKKWCRNYRNRKDLYWNYEVKSEYHKYKYLGQTIIKEIEFDFQYCLKIRRKKRC